MRPATTTEIPFNATRNSRPSQNPAFRASIYWSSGLAPSRRTRNELPPLGEIFYRSRGDLLLTFCCNLCRDVLGFLVAFACAAHGAFTGSDLMPWMPYGVLAGWHARAFSARSRAMYLFVRSERELGRSSKSRVLGRANRRASNHRAVCRSEPDHGRWRDRPPKIMVIDSV